MTASDKELIQSIKNVDCADQLFDIVTEHTDVVSSRVRTILGRQLDKFETDSSVKVALLGNFTLDFFEPELKTAFATLRQGCRSYVAPFNQYYQELLNKDSGLQTFGPDLIVLCLAMIGLSPDLYYRFSELVPEKRHALADDVINHVKQWATLACAGNAATLLISNFVSPPRPQQGIADFRETCTEAEFYQKLNRDLRLSLLELEAVNILDIAGLVTQAGWQTVYDPKMYYTAKILWGSDFLCIVSREVVKFYVASRGLAKKCLVLDLDNTLWGGVLGEEGVGGIKIGRGDPIGEAYLDFQYQIKALKQRGILLAICSKNNQADVEEAFEERQEMPLRLTDFTATRINWNSKNTNLIELAEELNIGLDSLVFIDDNPVEINLVRHMLPEVTSILLPSTHEKFPQLLESLSLFEKLRILKDDREKTEQYTQKKQRSQLQKQSTDLMSYLKSLGTCVKIRVASREDLPRVHQLFTKTNQFNVTTIRYSISDLQRFLISKDHDLWCYSVCDRFGELGLVGSLLIKHDANTLSIDSFIMSCRSIGRGVETSVINWLKNHYLIQNKYDALFATYVPTKKNIPVEDLFDKHGFNTVRKTNERTEYCLETSQAEPQHCDWITLEILTR